MEFFLRISNAILKEENRFKLDFDMFYFAKQMSKESVYSKMYSTGVHLQLLIIWQWPFFRSCTLKTDKILLRCMNTYI